MDTSGDWIVKKGAVYWNHGERGGALNGRWFLGGAAILTYDQATAIAEAMPWPVEVIHIPGTK